jgi:alpha-glucosidase
VKKLPGLVLSLILLSPLSLWAEVIEVLSPDGTIRVKVEVGDQVTWSVFKGQETLLLPSQLSLEISGNRNPGVQPRLRSHSIHMVNEVIEAEVPVKNRYIENHYNELLLHFKEGYNLAFRAYDEGVAYRFITAYPENSVEVIAETVAFHFEENHRLFWPMESSPTFQSHYEAAYRDIFLGDLTKEQYGSLPMLLETRQGTQLLITEADLYDYPNLFLFGTGANSLRGVLPKAILETYKRGDRAEVIASNANYLAKTQGSRSFPWRVMVIASEDRELLENELVYKLSSPCVLADIDWIRPGKVAWDWWNANNIYGVDFRAGLNTETYKYYIDFASAYGLEYIILDEGWSVSTLDLRDGNPELDLEQLFAYAESKNVGIILWVLWNALDKDLEATLDRFAGWGAKGIKVDFMVRADQDMVNYYERVAKEAAKRELLVNFHGAYKPSGLNRKYPNVVNYEGVKGMENSKWEEAVSPWHDVLLPFTRMVAGPMDYTPGAMINASKENFRPVFTQPMSQGTRAHQAAMYVLYDAPLQMLSDNPSNYLKEPEYTRFIVDIPVSWDQTIGLPSRVGEYVVMARKKGDVWYLGAMTNWDARTLEIDAAFLENVPYRIEYIEDGPNADRHAADYRMNTRILQPGEKITVKMAPGGGWVAILRPLP